MSSLTRPMPFAPPGQERILQVRWSSVGVASLGVSRRGLADAGRFEKVVRACKKHGLRPLFSLNAHHGGRAPCNSWKCDSLQRQRRGAARSASIRPLSRLVAGRSGLCGLTDYWAAEVLFTKIEPDGSVALSKPLPKDLPAGNARAATLKYLPFYPSRARTTAKSRLSLSRRRPAGSRTSR